MHSSFTRIQGVFGFFTTVACVLAGFIAASDLLSIRKPSGTIVPTNVQVYEKQTPAHIAKFLVLSTCEISHLSMPMV